ncbi:hypothetical protein [Aurantiacibacter poecillastricola]|uniref:hypothetical protein n=1 Tax=Aurantiacibacter poecillastricola TaxID=3064385 RepID=UPI00273D7F22|nr:hypothetical protein [Aurantiacibacter sp. 219JJ12-13]MDP5262127.1 hypothetical protein [Aurantiacibacter sp. 219JJ12-13]
MILRELFIFVAAFAAFASAVAAYLAVFHGEATLKEILSTAFAAVIGLYVGRYIERRLADGRA